MKLKPVKYNLKLGILALLPFVASCTKPREGVVVDKDRDYLYVDFDGDSLADASIYFHNNHYILHAENERKNREQKFLFDYVKQGDTINLETRRMFDNDVQLITSKINTINGKSYIQCKALYESNKIRSHQK